MVAMTKPRAKPSPWLEFLDTHSWWMAALVVGIIVVTGLAR